MNSILSINYATLSRKFHEQTATNFRRRRKSQTVSDQSRELLFVCSRPLTKVRTASAQLKAIRESLTPESRRPAFVACRALRKVGTASPLFKPRAPAAILSTRSIELRQSKIQTPSGEFSRSRLRNLHVVATPGGAS